MKDALKTRKTSHFTSIIADHLPIETPWSESAWKGEWITPGSG
jgi:hypothetical protein